MGAQSVRSPGRQQSASRYERMRANGVIACDAVLVVLDTTMPDEEKLRYLRDLCSGES